MRRQLVEFHQYTKGSVVQHEIFVRSNFHGFQDFENQYTELIQPILQKPTGPTDFLSEALD